MRKTQFIVVAAMLFILAPACAFAVETWTYFNLVSTAFQKPFGHELPLHVVSFSFVAVLLVILSLVVGGRYRAKLARYEQWQKLPVETRGACPIDPHPGFSLDNFFEGVIQTVLGLMNEIIGHNARKFFPLIGSLAFIILFSNCLGLLPASAIPTANVNTNAAMAITVFLLYHYFGMKEHGVLKYLNHFMGPLEGTLKYILAPIMVPIELVSHFARPLSLSIRLFGNMFGDHTVFAVFMSLVALPLVYPLPFSFLGLLVCVVQTLVFCMLSTVYISLAVAHDH